MSEPDFDVAVVGGGPAGLAAGLWLARYRRRVRIVDGGHPRNRTAWAVHGYPGLPDLPPGELRRRLRDQAAGAGAELCEGRVLEIDGRRDDFGLTLGEGERFRARRVLLAFGLRDELPPLAGLERVYGTSVFHCPDCDGPSMVGARVAVFGHDRAAAALALYLLTWAEHVTILADGRDPTWDHEAAAALAAAHIAVRRERVRELVTAAGRLRHLELEGSDPLAVEALFFHLGVVPASDLATRFGCRVDAAGHVAVDSGQETSVRGVFAAGDIVGPPFLAVSAAASGVRAALALHRSLLPDSWHV